ncbi:MAG: hypothetical protein NTY74_01830 [Ignavibacteriae bacterium]|nr:hypothetical protein [Ignavibacteriota bacterium]
MIKKSKLIKLLSSLSKQELKEFERFLTSIYFNEGKNYKHLVRELKKFHPEFNHPKLTNEYIHLKAFGKSKLNQKVFLNRLSKLSIVLEEYLIHKMISSNKIRRKTILAETLFERGCFDYLKTVSTSLEKDISELPYDKSVVPLKELGNIKTEYYYLMSDYHNAGKSSENLTLINFLEGLISFMAGKREMYNYENFYNHKPEYNVLKEVLNDEFIDNVISKISEYEFPYKDILILLYNNYKIGTNSADDDVFFKTRDYLYNNHKNISGELSSTLFACLNDYCNNKIEGGNSAFMKYKFEICKFFVSSEMFSSQYIASGTKIKYIHHVLFMNTFNTSIEARELEWAESFVVLYSKLLHPDERQGIYDFCYARIYANKGDFKKALVLINKIKTIPEMYKISLKITHLKFLYKLNNFVDALKVVDSLKNFLKKHSDETDFNVKTCNAFLKYYVPIFELKLKPDKKMIKSLHKEVIDNKDSNNYGLGWLMDRLEELKNEYC